MWREMTHDTAQDSCTACGGGASDGVRHFGAAGVDGTGDLADALVERADDVLAAIGQGLRQIIDALAEQFLELREPRIKRGAEFVAAAGDALVEGVDVIAHRLGHVLLENG